MAIIVVVAYSPLILCYLWKCKIFVNNIIRYRTTRYYTIYKYNGFISIRWSTVKLLRVSRFLDYSNVKCKSRSRIVLEEIVGSVF